MSTAPTTASYLKGHRKSGLKVGDTVRMETNSDKSGLIIRRGKKDNQLSLELKVRPKL